MEMFVVDESWLIVVAKLGGKGAGVVNPEKPQGEIYKLEKKGPKRVVYNNLPEKKNLQDLL